MQQKSPDSPTGSSFEGLCGALVVVVPALLILGCTTVDKPNIAASTHPTVSINVYSSGAATPADWICKTKGIYTICVNEEPIDLTNDSEPVTITWALVAPGWRFTSNGIEVKGGGWHEHLVTPTQYAAYNRKDKLYHKYSIAVTNGTDTVT
jgi:hypothetical protein